MRRTVGLVVFGLAVMALTLAVTVSWMQDKAILREEKMTRVTSHDVRCYAANGLILSSSWQSLAPPDTSFDAQGILRHRPDVHTP